jgi:hypothetical protein
VNINIDEEESGQDNRRADSRARAQEFNDINIAGNTEKQTK